MSLPIRKISVALACSLASAFACTSSQPRNQFGQVDTAPIPAAPAGVTAFVNVGVVPMDQERVLASQTVLVQGGRIMAIGPTNDVRIPAGATRIDGTGKYLIPGLADMHAHVFMDVHGDVPSTVPVDSVRAERRLALEVANGVTTLRNMDYAYPAHGEHILRLRERAVKGAILSPRIYTAGSWARVPSKTSYPAPADIARYITEYQAAGYDFVKSYFEPGPVFDSVAAAAKRIGLPIAGHVPPQTTFAQAMETLKSFEHPMTEWDKAITLQNPDTGRLRALAAEMHRRGVWNCPTQSHYVDLHGFPVHNGVIKGLQDGGVGLLLGTDDAQRPGRIARELQAFVAEGLTPYQALATGTRNVATYFGTLDQVGTITVGKRADLVLLPGNPLADVANAANPVGVMLGGRWVPREIIDRRIAELTPKP